MAERVSVREIRAAIRLSERRVDAASAAMAVHLEDVPSALLDDLHAAFGAHREASEDRMVFELGRHLPGVRPALVALAVHISQQEPDQIGRCCREV